MKIEKYIQFILLLLILIYFSQEIIFAQGGIISQLVLLIILSISLIYFAKTLISKERKLLFYKVWTALLLTNVCLYIFIRDFSNTLHFSKLKGLLLITLPFYSFYYFAEKGILKTKSLMWLFVVMLPIMVIKFYLERAEILSMRSWDNENVVNNVVYLFFLRRKKSSQLLLQ